MIVVIGGMGSLTGSVIAGVLVTVMLELLRAVEQPMNFSLYKSWYSRNEDGYLFLILLL